MYLIHFDLKLNSFKFKFLVHTDASSLAVQIEFQAARSVCFKEVRTCNDTAV